jgi:hypothetical protein
MNNAISLRLTIIFLFVLTVGAVRGLSQSGDFTYQGRLLDSSLAANGNYDFQFSLYDAQSNGILLGTRTRSGVAVSSGIFTVRLDFPASSFDGTDRFLEIGVKPTGGPNAYTVLAPRQPITSAPYSVRSLNAATADLATNSNQLGGIPSDGFIHNGTVSQPGDFNISGNGVAAGTLTGGAINSSTNYQIGNSRVLGVDGNANTFVGLLAGQSNTTGSTNTFVGYFAGKSNTTGFNNSYLGWGAGGQSTTANNNSFFGNGAGSQNTANFNSFFGSVAGSQNTTGTDNSFFGTAAGTANTTGGSNSFFGRGAGAANTIGHDNTFIGSFAGTSNTGGPGLNNGDFNTFVGSFAGTSNTTGFVNSFFGYNSGFANTSGEGNSYFGYEAGKANSTSCCNAFFGYRAGQNATAGGNSFFGNNAGVQNTTGTFNSIFGVFAGEENTTGSGNSFFGTDAGLLNVVGDNNSFFGKNAGQNSKGSNNSALGIVAQTSTNVNNGTAIGANAFVTQDNSLVLGSINGINGAAADTKVGIGTTAPNAPLHIAGSGTNVLIGSVTAGCAPGYAGIGFGSSLNCLNVSVVGNGTDTTINRPTGGAIYFMQNAVPEGGFTPAGDLYSLNKIGVGSLGAAGSTALCRNALTQIATCSSSLRYKKDLHAFTPGLSLVRQLNPITFRWKADNMLDLGFGAEDVAKVEPLLVTHNDKGEVEGVKYDRISAVLVNAVKQQQTQIEAQQTQIAQQQLLIDGLKKLVCQNKKQAKVCK